MTTLAGRTTTVQPNPGAGMPLALVVNALWTAALAVAAIAAGISIWRLPISGMPVNDLEDVNPLFSLSFPVQAFIAILFFAIAALSIVCSVQLLRKRASGRYIALLLDYGVVLFGGFYLIQLLGIFIGFDEITRALQLNAWALYAIAGAYLLNWFSARFDEGSMLRTVIERLVFVIVGIALFGLMLAPYGTTGTPNALVAANAILSRYSDPQVWLVTAAVIFSAIVGWQVLHLGTWFQETPAQQEAWQGWLMLSPNIFGFVLFFAGPLLLSLYLSFTNDTVGGVPEVIGLKNYGEIVSLQVRTQTDLTARPSAALDNAYEFMGSIDLGNQRLVVGARDSLFWYSLRNTFLYCILLIPLSILPALVLALVLNSKLPGMKFYRAIYFLPSVAAVVGTALIWRWLYDPTIGFINYAILGIVDFMNSTFNAGWVDPKISWLTDERTQLLSLVLMGAWQVIGYNTVLFLAGLQGIPKIMYEAATVDGANRWNQLRFVTIPLLAPTTFFVLINVLIAGLQVFNEPYALISQRPMPISATTSVFYLYNRGFFRFEFGYASAVAWILFFIIFTITFIQFRIQQRQGFDAYTGG